MSQYDSSKNSIYKLYKFLFEMDIEFGKKKNILRSLFIGENWTWRIMKISKSVVVECKDNNFHKPPRRFQRHHADKYEFAKTASAMLGSQPMPFEEWVRYIDDHEKTYLLTKEEHHNWKKSCEKPILYDVDLERKLFRNQSIGWEHKKNEEEFIRELVETHKL
jgi:hypothetical protein